MYHDGLIVGMMFLLKLMTVTEEVRNGDNVPEYTLLFRPMRARQTVFLAGRILIM